MIENSFVIAHKGIVMSKFLSASDIKTMAMAKLRVKHYDFVPETVTIESAIEILKMNGYAVWELRKH